MQNKSDLRQVLLAARRAIEPAQRRAWDAAIGDNVLHWWNVHRTPTLGVYWPIRGEPDLSPVYAVLVERGVRLALPVVVGHAAPLHFAAWSPGDPMQKDAFGVATPAARSPAVQPDAILIPCVGFNAGRMRLGYGGGFYDRTLALAPRPAAIGIAYSNASAEFGSEAHDIALDLIITEK